MQAMARWKRAPRETLFSVPRVARYNGVGLAEDAPMAVAWEYRIYDQQQLAHSAEVEGAVELGRQFKGEDGPYCAKREDDRTRLVLARYDDDKISRRHVLVEPLPDRKLRITNLSRSLPLCIQGVKDLPPLATLDTPGPVVLILDKRAVRIKEAGTESTLLKEHSLGGDFTVGGAYFPSQADAGLVDLGKGVDADALMRWFQVTMGVLQSAASKDDFFMRAAQALVDVVRLDSGRVLLRDQSDWKEQAHYAGARADREADWQPSRRIWRKVIEEKRTFWEVPAAVNAAASLQGIKAIVAAPILDRHGDVIGALYG